MGVFPAEWLNHRHLSMMSSAFVFYMTPVDMGIAVIASIFWSNLTYYAINKIDLGIKLNEESKFIIALVFGVVMAFLTSAYAVIVEKLVKFPENGETLISNMGSLAFVTPLTFAIFYIAHLTKDKELSGLVYGLITAGTISMCISPFIQVGLFTLTSALSSWIIMKLLIKINDGKKSDKFHIMSVVFGIIIGASVQMFVHLGQEESTLNSASMVFFVMMLSVLVLSFLGLAPFGFDTIFKLK